MGVFTITKINGVERTCQAPPTNLPLQMDKQVQKTVLVLDEISSGSEEMQRAVYDLLCNKRIDNQPLQKGVVIIATRNTAEDGANDEELPPPLNNRCAHFKLESSPAEWVKYARSKGVSPTLTSWIENTPQNLHTFNIDKVTPAWCSPRALCNLSEAVGHEVINLDNEFQSTMMTSIIGEADTAALRAFIKAGNLPDIPTLINKPDAEVVASVTSVEGRLLLTHALSAYATEGNIKNIIQILGMLPAEYNAIAFRIIMEGDTSFELMHVDAFAEWLKEHEAMLVNI